MMQELRTIDDLTASERELRTHIQKLLVPFDDAYWLKCDTDALFPHALHRALADAGWLGIAMPEAYGGANLGIRAAAVMMQTIAESGAGFSGASAVHMNIFGLNPVVLFGTDDQKRRHLPPLIAGQEKACFAVTEPDAGLDTSRITTSAVCQGDRYIINGRKIWISTAQVADKILLLARSAPRSAAKGTKPTDGLTLFYTQLDKRRVEIREIHKMGRAAVDSNQVFFDNYEVPASDRLGEDGKGFDLILHGLNPERILIAAEAVGLGRAALRKATSYANERRVFDRAIGSNQGIQHPIAKAWMALEAANLMVFKAASLYDANQPCGIEANAAKYLAAEAGFEACETAVLVHGGMGYARDFHVERYMREAMLPRIVPVSREMILNFIAERALGLPRSY